MTYREVRVLNISLGKTLEHPYLGNNPPETDNKVGEPSTPITSNEIKNTPPAETNVINGLIA